jgi:N-acetylmuramoyl-L-alanine amidase
MHAGSRGEDVRDVQQRLIVLGHKIEPDEREGLYGASTVAAVDTFQRDRGLPADGIVGPETWGELVEAGYLFGDRTLYLRYPFFRGDDVRALQRRLNSLGFDAWREDGIFGDHVDRAVREFQRNVGRAPDGIVGPETYEALARLRPDTDAPSRALVREAEEIRAGTPMQGAVIAIDPGHGPAETDFAGEAAETFRLAGELAAELERRGGKAAILRAQTETPTGSERARKANELGAAACIAIHVHPRETGDAPTCIFFGTEATRSPAGQRLAELMGDVVPGGTGMLTVAILRETRMPAVQVQISPEAASNQADLASGLADAIEAFLGPQETG